MLKRSSIIFLIGGIIITIVLAFLTYNLVIGPAQSSTLPQPTALPTTPPSPTAKATLAPMNQKYVLGVDSSGQLDVSYAGVPWIRLGYPSCGWGDLKGDTLKKTVAKYHQDGVRVLLTLCQRKNTDANFFDTGMFNDAAQGNADAVQCGNEQMKQDAAVSFLYIPPDRFAKFYDLCQTAIHAVNPNAQVVLGSLDPHVGGIDFGPLQTQVQYLDQMQTAMNRSVNPGGNWNWRQQTLGLIDSWHNGYPDENVNSLQGLFEFWAQQFHVDLNSGALGKHIWVVEGTGCFKGCGVDTNDKAQVAISHILTLTTDVQTTMRYAIPFFYFSGKDFQDQGLYWPIGILDANGKSKPLRQDLSMGARTLTLTCPTGKVTVGDQLQLLSHLYARCTLPDNYRDMLTN